MSNSVRRERRIVVFVAIQLLLSGGCLSQAQVSGIENAIARPAQPTTKPVAPFSLTVYSTADPATFSPQDIFQEHVARGGYGVGFGSLVVTPGFGVVREIRPIRMSAGINQVEFTDVAAGIDPTTVAFRSLTAPNTTTVLEQNFDYDLASADQLLQKYVGKNVTMAIAAAAPYSPSPSPGSQTSVVKGVLLSAAGGSYVLKTASSPDGVMMISAASVVSIAVADSSSVFVTKPTLRWKVNAKQDGEHKVQVTYQTDGLTWRADYGLLISPDEKTADLSAWVTLVNGSGISYPEAALKLVAGNVQRFVPPSRSYTQWQGYGVGQGGGGGFGGGVGFQEKIFFEYHMYTLGVTTTLGNNSTKQIELFPPKLQTPIEKVYVYNGLPSSDRQMVYRGQFQPGDDFGRTGNKDVDIYVRLKNSEANHLGIPIPAGRLRTYKIDPSDDSREFIGEDLIPHTPKDEPILARLGTAFELVGERKQVFFHRVDGNTVLESFEITLRNHKDVPASVIVREILYRGLNWQILEPSDKWTKEDYRTIHFPVEVPPNGEKKISYEVRYTYAG